MRGDVASLQDVIQSITNRYMLAFPLLVINKLVIFKAELNHA